jgi:hypothetical protein
VTPKALNRENSKWPEAKIFLYQIYCSQNVFALYLVKDFFQNAVLGDFLIKK